MSSFPCLQVALLLSASGMLRLEGAEVIEFSGRTMGTTYSVKIAAPPPSPGPVEKLQAEVEMRLREINRQMSHYEPGSEISAFNRSTSTQPTSVSPDFAHVVRFALWLNQRSLGAFDPTLGPLIDLWGFSTKGTVLEPPNETAIAAARATTGARHLLVTTDGQIQKTIPHLQLNLGGLAKGFAVDAVACLLADRQCTNALVRIGGEIVARGRNDRGEPWRIGIASPRTEADEDFVAVVHLSGQAASTSGNYRQFFIDEQGRRFGHILDPRTGAPVRHNLAGVTVVAEDGLTADGLATSLFVMGAEQGLPWIERWTNAAALFLVEREDGLLQFRASARFPPYIRLDASAEPPAELRPR